MVSSSSSADLSFSSRNRLGVPGRRSLVAPGLVATSIFAFITAYNEFIVALTFLLQAHSEYTLPIYVTYFFGRGGAQWGPIMAASTMYTIPVMIFFLIVRRRLVGGLTAGAIKG